MRFVHRSRGMTTFVTDRGFVWSIREPVEMPALPLDLRPDATPAPATSRSLALGMTFEGVSEHATLGGGDPRDTYVNYFLGNDPSRWTTRVPTWSSLRFSGLYPGVDAVVREDHGSPVYDLVLAPGADPDRIAFRIQGADRCSIDADGALVVDTALGALRQSAPVAFVRDADGRRREVPCRFRQLAPDRFGFDVAMPAAGEALVIDPTLTFQPLYFNYLGGTGHDVALDVALTTHGRATVTGATVSPTFVFPPPPAPPPPPECQPVHADPPNYDVFVAQLRADGTTCAWITFIGGSTTGSDPLDIECGYGVAVDATGAVYLCGITSSDSGDFPTTTGAFLETPSMPGISDGFVLKLDSSGTTLVYSTLLGGTQEDQCQDIAVDALGQAYVCGTSLSGFTGAPEIPFPTTPGVVQPAPSGSASPGGFFTKLSANGSQLIYSTWVRAVPPGPGDPPADGVLTRCAAIALDFNGLPQPNAVWPQPKRCRAQRDGARARARVGHAARGLLRGTRRIRAVVPNAWVTGDVNDCPFVSGSHFQTTQNAFQPNYGGGQLDAFVTGLNSNATSFVYSTFLGGDDNDEGRGIVVAGNGMVLVTGGTSSDLNTGVGFPQVNHFGPFGGEFDMFVTRIDPTAATPQQTVSFSSYLGGDKHDEGFDIWTDSTGATAFVTGHAFKSQTQSFPMIGDPLTQLQIPAQGGFDAFLVKVRVNTFQYSTLLGGDQDDAGFGLAVDASGIFLAGWSQGGNAFQVVMDGVDPQVPLAGFSPTNNGGGHQQLPEPVRHSDRGPERRHGRLRRLRAEARAIGGVAMSRHTTTPLQIATVLVAVAWAPVAAAQEILHTFNGNTFGENFGLSADSAGDVNADGIPDVVGGAPRDSEVITWGGSATVYLGGLGTPWFTVFGSGKFDQLGHDVAGAGDVDADGFCDVVVGVPGFQAPGVHGLMRVVSGLNGNVLIDIPGPPEQTTTFAACVSGAGDLDGDGRDDVTTADGVHNVAWVFSGADGSTLLTASIPGSPGGCPTPNGIFSAIERLDDVDADGVPDYVIATADPGGALVVSGASAAILYCVPGDPTVGIQNVPLATTDDVNGDGFRDFLVGVALDDTFGQNTGLVRAHSGASGAVLHTMFGKEPGASFGQAMAGCGDINGDGVPDLLLGAGNSLPGGKVYIHSGADASLLTVFDAGSSTGLGASLAKAGDVNGDGLSDLIIGAPGTNNFNGAVHVYSGRCGMIQTYGTGCPGSGGFTPAFATQDACANVGQTMTFSLSDALGGAPAFLLLGGGKGSAPVAGCTLLLQPVYPVTIPFALSGAGAGPGAGSTTLFTILPASTAGQTIAMQFFVADISGPQGYAASNAILIRPR